MARLGIIATILMVAGSSYADDCCVGRVGDANGQGVYPDEVTLGDIMLMVDAKFISGDCSKLPCMAEADVNQDGGANPTCDDNVTLGDIMALVDFLFITGPSIGLPECLSFSLESLTPSQGAPGTNITGVISSSIPLPDTLILYLGDIALPIGKNENSQFTFCIPMISAGDVFVIVKTKDSLQSNKMRLTILDATPTGLPPGQITSEILTTMNDMSVFTSEAVAWMREMNHITPGDSIEIADNMLIYNQLISNLNAEVATWPDSSKAAFDSYLKESGIADLFNFEGSGLKSRIPKLRASLSALGQYDEFDSLVLFDNLSMILANIKAGVQMGIIATLASAVVTAAATAPSVVALGGINLGLSIVKAVIDGWAKTDLYYIIIEFQPLNGPTIEVGEKAQVQFLGGFRTQSAPEKVTVGLVFESAFYVLSLANVAREPIDALVTKILNMATTSAEKTLMPNQGPISLDHNVVVDPKYYSLDFSGVLLHHGFVNYFIMAKILSSLGFYNPGIVQNSFNLNSTLATFDPETFQLTAVAEGTIPSSAFEARGWLCKPICANEWYLLNCFGTEWFKPLSTSDISISSLTIYPSSQPVVTTAEVSSITPTTAQCGGNITSDGGASVTVRGVCWSTNPTPTVSDSKTTDGTGTGSFASLIIGLTASTTYYVRAYATNDVGTGYGSVVSVTTLPFSGTVTDIDGNVYQTVTIGTQVWMTENLKVTHYRNGEAIPNVIDGGIWESLYTGAYCEYNNDVNNVAIYGRLFNWYAVADSRNIAPAGWHVPTEAEWQTLGDYLGGNTVAGGKMKEAGTSHWLSPNTGATNESGFSALPGGYRNGDWASGYYYRIGYDSYFWSSTGYYVMAAWCRQLTYSNSAVLPPGISHRRSGFSVRCVKD